MAWLHTLKNWSVHYQAAFHTGLILFIALILHVTTILVYKHLLSRVKADRLVRPMAVLNALRKPIVVLIWYLAIILVLLNFMDYFKDIDVLGSLKTAASLGITIILVWFLLRLINNIEQAMLAGKIGKRKYDETTVDGVSKLSRIVLFVMAGLALLQGMGVPLAGVYTAAGGAGIGITLAAQDMLRNFFGGLVLYFDRPFSIGDWISSPDKKIEGTVEKIGWRTTRIRTFDKRPLYVPNSTFLTVSVENPSRMLYRRIRTDVGVRYNDFKVIAKITVGIEDMLRADDEIATDQTIWVNLVDFAASSLNFRIYAFTKTTDWIKFQQVQQKIFLKVLDIIEENNAEAAFPTRTVLLPNGVSVNQEEVK
jgi:MscS family membrane protein